MTLEQTKYSAVDTYISSIRNGVTTVFDHHASFGHIRYSLFTIADVAKELDVRSCLCYEISDCDGMDVTIFEKTAALGGIVRNSGGNSRCDEGLREYFGKGSRKRY